MADERVYSIEQEKATPARPVNLSQVGLKERHDLQEWVIAHPEILGSDVLIVAFEFDRWTTSGGERQLDRLDVLGLDADGRLVLAELKRDRAPDTVQLQSLKYAALVSRFTESDVVTAHARYLSSRGQTVSEDESRELLRNHAGELDPDTLRRPRIVIVAGGFTPVTTASVVWLVDQGLDITLQRVQAYQTARGDLVMTVSQIFPVPDVEDFMVSPLRAEVRAAQDRTRGAREKSTVVKLVDAGTIADGTELTLRPTSEVTAEVRDEILEWVASDPSRARATWFNDRRAPLEWAYDGKRYRPTAIVSQILRDAAELERSPRGPAWWVTPDGDDLARLAGSAETRGFDWSPLHTLMGGVPPGRWTTYGDLADVVGTAAQPVGRHISACAVCPNPQRVLGSQGKPQPGFQWRDATRADTQRQALEGEGVRFISDQADPASRLSGAELAALEDMNDMI